MPSDEQWKAMHETACKPLAWGAIDWRVDSEPYERSGQHTCRVVGYADRTAVMDRLDEAFGPGNWDFDFEVLATIGQKGEPVIKGRLRVYDRVYHDIGTASNTEPWKGAESDALKRCATQAGVGRYLSRLGQMYVACDAVQKQGGKREAKINAQGWAQLRAFTDAWNGRAETFEATWNRARGARGGSASSQDQRLGQTAAQTRETATSQQGQEATAPAPAQKPTAAERQVSNAALEAVSAEVQQELVTTLRELREAGLKSSEIDQKLAQWTHRSDVTIQALKAGSVQGLPMSALQTILRQVPSERQRLEGARQEGEEVAASA